MPSDELLARHDALIRSDNEFQRVARLRQALWRETRGLPVGLHRERPLGSRLAMPFAKESLANYLTDTIRAVVRAEVCDPARSAGRMYSEPRIFDDLLSSQPLCFNLFAELQQDLALASRVFALLLERPGVQVTEIAFEYSPGRGEARVSGDHSAFDVFVRYADRDERDDRGFVGIEVKYVENLTQPEARHRPRYDEVADAMAVFRPDARDRLRRAPLEQFWRDHLLAGSLALDRAAGFTHGDFVVLYPSENLIVASALETYASCLTGPHGFRSWTLETFLDALDHSDAGPWCRDARARYLG